MVAAIAKGKQDCLYLGNLNSQRDWGHAKDYVEENFATRHLLKTTANCVTTVHCQYCSNLGIR
jgi:GDP-D-mannose dehydratase